MQDKKQKIQIAILAVLVLICFGYMGLKLMGGKSHTPPQPEASQPSQTKPTETLPAPDNAIISTAVAKSPAQGNPRDPFMPMMETMVAAAPSSSAARRFSNNSVPPIIPLGAGVGQSGTENGPASSQAAVPEAFPQYQLTGVITGQTNIAIIRLGESRYIVKEGQKIDGQYEVTSVSQEGVLLTRGGRSVFLKLGGDGNANKS